MRWSSCQSALGLKEQRNHDSVPGTPFSPATRTATRTTTGTTTKIKIKEVSGLPSGVNHLQAVVSRAVGRRTSTRERHMPCCPPQEGARGKGATAHCAPRGQSAGVRTLCPAPDTLPAGADGWRAGHGSSVRSGALKDRVWPLGDSGPATL